MPEGDALRRAATRLQPLVGQRITATSPNPRAQVRRVAERIDGHVLQSVEAVGKNLLLRFDGGIVVRSHLGMSGRWTVRARGSTRPGRPWLVLAGERLEGVLWNGPVLDLHARGLARLGPDILEQPPRLGAMLDRLAHADGRRFIGESLLDQSLVAGIGNKWLAEALWDAQLSPWRRLADVSGPERRRALAAAARLMTAALDSTPPPARVYRRTGRPCPRCGTAIRAHGQGDANRRAYWCPGCQRGGDEPKPV